MSQHLYKVQRPHPQDLPQNPVNTKMPQILQINVNGIRGKSRLLRKLAYDYDASVIVISELKTSRFYDYERADFEIIVGYTIYL